MSEPGGELELSPADEVATPPSQSRRPLLLTAIGVGVLALASLLVVLLDPTLFGDIVLDRGAVQHDVAAQFQQREGVAVILHCPSTMAVVVGRSYRCTGTTASGEIVPVRVVVTRTAPAAYSWTLR
jgi:hypothetical protein